MKKEKAEDVKPKIKIAINKYESIDQSTGYRYLVSGLRQAFSGRFFAVHRQPIRLPNKTSSPTKLSPPRNMDMWRRQGALNASGGHAAQTSESHAQPAESNHEEIETTARDYF
jgi:hypothetical protein